MEFVRCNSLRKIVANENSCHTFKSFSVTGRFRSSSVNIDCNSLTEIQFNNGSFSNAKTLVLDSTAWILV